MSRNQAWLLSLFLTGTGLLGCVYSGADTHPAPQQVEQISAQSSEIAPETKQASTPESKRAFLLAQQANELVSHKDYAGALGKLDAAIAMRGNVPEYSLMRCMLSERVSSQPQLECYASVVRTFEAGGTRCESNLNCVVAASMASLPEAQAYRRHYLEAPRSAADQEITDIVLKGFTREKYLHSILP
ncbi:hypothetical protein [Ralstonia pickettii]|nr:hypothetical protein [Ralstonia pickettii]